MSGVARKADEIQGSEKLLKVTQSGHYAIRGTQSWLERDPGDTGKQLILVYANNMRLSRIEMPGKTAKEIAAWASGPHLQANGEKKNGLWALRAAALPTLRTIQWGKISLICRSAEGRSRPTVAVPHSRYPRAHRPDSGTFVERAEAATESQKTVMRFGGRQASAGLLVPLLYALTSSSR